MSNENPHAIRESITVDHAIEVLNRMLQTDHNATALLFLTARVPCHEGLADDPTIQVRAYKVNKDDPAYSVGILGIINGLFGIDEGGWGLITAVTKLICTQDCKLPDEPLKVGSICPVCEQAGAEEPGIIRFGGIEQFRRTAPPEERRDGGPTP